MTKAELLKRERAALEKKTLYVQGGWGQTLTDANKVAFTTNPRWPYNQKAERKAKIMAASSDTIACDCVCGQKSIFDNLFGVNDQTTAMRQPCPDITIQAIMNMCSNVRDVSYNKEPDVCDFLATADYTHCGVYLGNNEVSESTHTGSDGLQIRAYAGRGWKWAGHLPWVEEDTPTPAPITKVYAVQVMANRSKAAAKKYLKDDQSVFYVDKWYKTAYTYKTAKAAKAAVSKVRKTYPDAFYTEYEGSSLVDI